MTQGLYFLFDFLHTHSERLQVQEVGGPMLLVFMAVMIETNLGGQADDLLERFQ